MKNHKHQEVLEKVTYYFKYAENHQVTDFFRRKMRESYDFYHGDQWDQADLDTLSARGQKSLTFNKINVMINALSGVEIQTRFRNAYKSHGSTEESQKLAKAITHLSYYIQESQKIPYHQSVQYRDSLICGIGWGNLYKDPQGGYVHEYVDPWNVLFDPDDLSPQLTDSEFVIRKRYISCKYAKNRWPHAKDYFDEYRDEGSLSGELLDRTSSSESLSSQGKKKLIIEVQWREYCDCFCGYDQQGHYFETFSQEHALELAGSKTLIEKNPNSSKVMRALFYDHVLLEYAPLNPPIPDLKDFTYIPTLFLRDFKSGCPYGLVSLMKDPQREINVRHTKGLFLLGSKSAILDASFYTAKDERKIREELKRPDSIFLKHANADTQIIYNDRLAAGQFEALQKSEQHLQMVSGLFNDFLGSHSNAQSGVAIRARQLQSVKNHIFSFDNIKMMKQRHGELLLSLIQGSGDENILAEILDDDEKEEIILNRVRYVNGKKIIFNDVRTLPLSIYVEEVPDYDSTHDERRENLRELLSNPNAQLILKSGKLLKRFGYRDGDEIAEEIKAAERETMAAQQQLNAQQNVEGQPR